MITQIAVRLNGLASDREQVSRFIIDNSQHALASHSDKPDQNQVFFGRTLFNQTDLDRLKQIYSNSDALGLTGESFLTDKLGQLVTPLRFSNTLSVNSAAMQDCLQGHSQPFLIMPNYAGVPVVMSYRPITGYGGCVMVHIHVSEAMKPVNDLRNSILFSCLLEGLIVFIATCLIGKKILTTENALRTLATTDELTGVANRLLFMELLKMELERFHRHASTTCLLMLDIDYFKAINDQYGHIVGDKVLQHITTLIEKNLRTVDSLGRIGGEEFCLLLPTTEVKGAQQFAERLCQLIAETPVEINDIKVSYCVSIGVTTFLPGDSAIITIIERADAALYQAKSTGRNRAMTSLMPASQELKTVYSV
jgi:diguanylate cyclase (GGDEF)-like protein